MRTAPKPPPRELKTATHLAVLKACTGDEAKIVHTDQATGMLGATRKGRFKFAAQILVFLVSSRK